jgi:hypothetical protein
MKEWQPIHNGFQCGQTDTTFPLYVHFIHFVWRMNIFSSFLQSEVREENARILKELINSSMITDLDCTADVLMGVPPSHFFQAEHRIQFRSRPMRFPGFSNHEKGAPRQDISKWSTVCSTFSRSGRSVVRCASLAKGGTSPHLHKIPTRGNKVVHKLFKRPSKVKSLFFN